MRAFKAGGSRGDSASPAPSADRPLQFPHRRVVSSALLIVLALAAVYGQTARNEFINYDDDIYLLSNPEVTAGLSWRGVLWAFGFHASNWHPLTWVSHMIDSQLFGGWAGGHHLVSAGLHAVNAILLLAVLRALTGSLWRSAAVAALFALHPLRVESVAWAAERKDVLSGLFWLLTTTAYLRYLRRPGAGRYGATLCLFALGLMAKPMLVTLPFVLLLLDWWPLGRAPRSGGSRPGQGSAGHRRTWPALVWEKAPFLALALASSFVTLRAASESSLPMVRPDLATKYGNAVLSYVRYAASFVWPAQLAPLYPYPRSGIAWAAAAAATLALILVTAVVISRRSRQPYLPVGWFWYLGTLVPVIGVVQTGALARGDRYTYLTMIGLTIAVVWSIGDAWPQRPRARGGLVLATVGALAALAVASGSYVRVWRNNLSLFGYAAQATEDNYIMLNNFAGALKIAGREEEAARVLEDAVRVNPEYCDARLNLGRTLAGLGRCQQALEPLNHALLCFELQEFKTADVAATHDSLASCYLNLGRLAEAQWHFSALRELETAQGGAFLGSGKR
jgi:tetratricopeptide (TPR) repeat protein